MDSEENSGTGSWAFPLAGGAIALFSLFLVLYVTEASKKEEPTIKEVLSEEDNEPRAQSFPSDNEERASDLEWVQGLVVDRLSQSLGAERATRSIEILDHPEGLAIRFRAPVIYLPGELSIHPDLKPVLLELGRIFSEFDHFVRVEAHTDEGEERGTRFSSGWDLSATRATWVLRLWFQHYRLAQKRFSVVGKSFFHPIEGKDANRRVELVILRK